MIMEKQTLKIAFSTQKGGIGKTTLTVLAASYLHYVKGLNVAVIDCDYPQHSIVEMRERDVDLVMNSELYKRMAHKQFSELKCNAYPVVESNSVDAVKIATELIEKSEPPLDIVFFDLPGTLNSNGVLKTLASMDYLFVPVSADRVVLESTLQFTLTLQNSIITPGKAKIKGMYIIWNMVDRREKSDLYVKYNKIIAELGLEVLKTSLPDSKRFRKEIGSDNRGVFRSTLFPIDKQLIKGSQFDELMREFFQKIKI